MTVVMALLSDPSLHLGRADVSAQKLGGILCPADRCPMKWKLWHYLVGTGCSPYENYVAHYFVGQHGFRPAPEREKICRGE